MIKAISKFKRKGIDISKDENELVTKILDGIADMEICLEELNFMFNGFNKVEEIKQIKIKKGAERAKEYSKKMTSICKNKGEKNMNFKEYLKTKGDTYSPEEERQSFQYYLHYGTPLEKYVSCSLKHISQADMKRLKALDYFITDENPIKKEVVDSVEKMPDFLTLWKKYPPEEDIFEDLRRKGAFYVANKIELFESNKKNKFNKNEEKNLERQR